MKQYVKCTQWDYSLYFKLAVVEQVEKGEMTIVRLSSATVSRGLHRSEVAAYYGQLAWQSSAQRSTHRELMTKFLPLTPGQ